MTASPAEQNNPKQCLHCGLDVPGNRDDSFCCAGCCFVFKTLHEHGLEKFYDFKKSLGDESLIQAPEQDKNFGYLDDEEYQKKYVTTKSDNSLQTSLFIQGIHCAACVWLLERLTDVCNGVTSAQVNFRDQTLRVSYNQEKVKLSEIAAKIQSFGYRPQPPGKSGELESSKARREDLLRIGIAGLCAGNTMLIAVSLYEGLFSGIALEHRSFLQWISLCISIPAVLIGAKPFFRAAIGGIRAGLIHIDLPISIGIAGGFLLSAWNTITNGEHVYFDSICMLIFLLLIGRWFQQRGVDKARREARLLPSIFPNEVQLVDGEKIVSRYIESLAPKDIVQISENQTIPVDGSIVSGSGKVSLAFLTGESTPSKVDTDDKVFAGSKLLSGSLQVEAETCGEDTRIGKLFKLVTDYSINKPSLQKKTDKLSAVFTIVVITGAIACFLFWYTHGIDEAFQNTLAFLVVACPCALGLSVPTALSVGLAQALQRGIVLKGESVVERLTEVDSVVFDKTGTLTHTELALDEVLIAKNAEWQAFSSEDTEIASTILSLEASSDHPIALAIRRKFSGVPSLVISEIEELPGKGVQGKVNNSIFKIGSPTWTQTKNLPNLQSTDGRTRIVLSKDDLPLAILSFRANLKEDAKVSIDKLTSMGKEIKILSGDSKSAVLGVANKLNISAENVLSETLPEGKLEFINQLQPKKSAMVGDGINDAAALAAAHVGIGIKGGVEASLQSADVYISSGKLKDVVASFTGSEKTIKVIKRNFVISIVYNVVGGSLALAGLMHPLAAAVLMPISSLSVIGSSLLGRKQRWI